MSKHIHKRYTPKHMVMDLINAFSKLELEGIPLSLGIRNHQETLTINSSRITETILPILHEYGIRIHEDQGQVLELNKAIEDMTFHEMIHTLTMMMESQFMDQVIVALEKGILQNIYGRLMYFNKNDFMFQDDLLFNHYQRALNQLMNVTPKNEETNKLFQRLQKVIRKQRSKVPIILEDGTYNCPSCTQVLYSPKQRFCQQCGQKLIKD